MAIGDLLFFASDGSLFDRAILWRTGDATLPDGGYVHVEVVVSATESVGALGEGIVRHAIPTGRHIVTVPTGALCDPRHVRAALAWIAARVGKPYGRVDIADDAASLVAPDGPFLVERDRFCCSDLATRFLAHAGSPLPDDLFDYPTLATPNSLFLAVAHLLTNWAASRRTTATS